MSKGKKPIRTAETAAVALFSVANLLRDVVVRRIVIALVALLVGGALIYGGWRQWGPAISASPAYRLDQNKIEVTTPPAWIHANIKADAIRAGGLDGLSILDPKLTEKVTQAFALQAWVASVTRVEKHHPARVIVELEYRQPVAMVEVAAAGERGLLPVDAEGVLLPPEDFSANQVRSYLRISVGAGQPEGPVGTPWGDPRIASAATVAAALGDDWKQLQLYRIVLAGAPAGEVPTALSFDIHTRDGAKVVWGHAPGHESSGEATASEKVAQLLRHFEEHGPLSATGKFRELNVRDGALRTSPVIPASLRGK